MFRCAVSWCTSGFSRISALCTTNPVILFPRSMFAATRYGEIQTMQEDYLNLTKRCEDRVGQLEPVNPHDVFVNNEVDLSKLLIFGFDFDHTLATYTHALDEFIFTEARNWLVKQMKYPEELMELTFRAGFTIRGLHFDLIRGYLMKVDSFHNIQLDTVHLGLTPVTVEQILEAYHGMYLPSTSLKHQNPLGSNLSHSHSSKYPVLFQLMDFFALPEFYLICCVIEFFERRHMNYQPYYVYQDISSSVSRVHKSGLLGLCIMGNPEKYIQRDPDLASFLNKLVTNNRKLFVISNSSSAFIDRGLRFLIGDDWRRLFDVIIARANKPQFFQQDSIPFRHMDECGTFKDWEAVKTFQRGHIYEGGSLGELVRLTNWNAENILYFGDHVYSDLADVSNVQGWTTAAVIPELQEEITVNNSERFRSCSVKLRYLEGLIKMHQHVTSPEAKALLDSWFVERRELRHFSKVSLNRHFGSIFRSFHNPSYFSRRLTQYAILYTSKLTNLYPYSLNHVFYPKRTFLPHEPC